MKARVVACKSCGGPAVWSKTTEGKWALFEAVWPASAVSRVEAGRRRHSCAEHRNAVAREAALAEWTAKWAGVAITTAEQVEQMAAEQHEISQRFDRTINRGSE